MSSGFSVIFDEFAEDMAAISGFVASANESASGVKARIAACNSATLLIAATFEEYIREMAREFARTVVQRSQTLERVPKKLVNVVWKRTMDALSKVKADDAGGSTEIFVDARSKFSIVYEFCTGDLSKDIYRDLIHNENNMRPNQINALFNISDLSDVCKLCSEDIAILEFLGVSSPNVAHGRILTALNEFFDRRNSIAHTLANATSSSPAQISTDIGFLTIFGRSLCDRLELHASR